MATQSLTDSFSATATPTSLFTTTLASMDLAGAVTTVASTFATSLRNITDRDVLVRQLESRRLELLITLLKRSNFTFDGALELVASANNTFRMYQHRAEAMMVKEGVPSDHVNLISSSRHYGPNDTTNPFALKQPTRSLVTILYALIVIAAVVGNLLVIVTHYMSRQWRKDISIFLINLAVTDIMLAVICIPFTMQQVLDFFWLSPTFLCAPVLYLQTLSAFASIYTLVVVGIDRLWFVLHPLRLRLTHGMRGRLIIIALWAVLAVTCSIQWMITRLRPVEIGATEFFTCQEELGEYGKAYAIGLFLSSYGLPLVALVITYGSLACIIWRNKPPGSQISHQHRQQQITEAKKRLIKSMTIIVVLFAVMWLPLHILNLVYSFNPHHPMFRKAHLFGLEGRIDTINNYRKYYTPCHLLAMCTACVNPLVYTFFHRSFRQACLQVLGRDCFGIQQKLLGRTYSGRGHRHHHSTAGNNTQNFRLSYQLSLRDQQTTNQTQLPTTNGTAARRPTFPTHTRLPRNSTLLLPALSCTTAADGGGSGSPVTSTQVVSADEQTPIDPPTVATPLNSENRIELKTFAAASTSSSSGKPRTAPLCVSDEYCTEDDEFSENESDDDVDYSSIEDEEDEALALAGLSVERKNRRTRNKKKRSVLNGSVHKYVDQTPSESCGSNGIPIGARRPSIFAQLKQSVLGGSNSGISSNRRMNNGVKIISSLSAHDVVRDGDISTAVPAAGDEATEMIVLQDGKF